MKELGLFYKFYQGLAVVVLNLIIFLCLLNFSSYMYYNFIKRNYNPIQLKYQKVNYKLIYPNLTDNEIIELQKETWSRPYFYEQFTQFKEAPFHGKYVNVSEAGFRFTENQGPWPPDKKFYNIFLFGGSTTFNYGVADNETIASNLQKLIAGKFNKIVKVYNFGRGHYYSSQERILFENLLTSGFVPDMAIFIDGLNDCTMPDNTLIFTKEISSFIQKRNFMFIKNLSLWKLLVDIRQGIEQRMASAKSYQEDTSKYNDSKEIDYLTNRYMQNKKIIAACAKAYDIKLFFVWQPAPTYKYDLKYHLFPPDPVGPINYLKFAYRRMEKLNQQGLLGNDFIWCADIQEGKKENFYTDSTHYSATMSKLVAADIVQGMQKSGLFKD
ncbi:MAG: SGNH/GDSL hydrolase family protein [Desulfobaccales bacterium]